MTIQRRKRIGRAEEMCWTGVERETEEFASDESGEAATLAGVHGGPRPEHTVADNRLEIVADGDTYKILAGM